MTEIPFPVLMADLWILCGGMLTIPWCDVMIRITDWRNDPVTWQKVVILLIGIFFPLMLFSLTAIFMYPEAFHWSP